MPTVITTSTTDIATAYSNQRKIDRTSNGVLWTTFWSGAAWNAGPLAFRYSTDNGATWQAATGINWSGSAESWTPNASFFIDQDDYAHIVYKDRSNGMVLYRRGTPNAGRTSYTWSVDTQIGSDSNPNYPDIVVHREGSGWAAHVVTSWNNSQDIRAYHWRLDITSAGAITVSPMTLLPGYFTTTALHSYPSIDFNHTGDGKTVAGGTPHLYVAWSAGTTGTNKGIRFKKATYSAGAWTWGTEREIDSTQYIPAHDYWLNCLFDGSRVLIVGNLYSGSATSVMLYDRDSADTTTTATILLGSVTAANMLRSGSSSYDKDGNIYVFGAENTANGPLNYRKWARSTATLSAKVLLDATGGTNPFVSAKRGYSNQRIEFIYTDGTASPYSVTYDSINLNTLPAAPTNVSVGTETGSAVPISWTHNDQEGNPQSKYKFRWRKVI